MTHAPKPTDILGYLIGTLDKSIELEKQNAEMLEALKDIANTELISDELITIAKDAIAKTEGKT